MRRRPPSRREPIAPRTLHVAVASTASLSKLRDPDTGLRPFLGRDDVQLHLTDPTALRTTSGTGRVGLLLALEHLFRSETPERALAVVDSALHLRHLRQSDLHLFAARLPGHLRPVVLSADGRAESGIGTIVRFRLQRSGLRLVLQAAIAGVGLVDLLVEGRLIIECDGREWHDEDEAFERDRRRDLTAASDHSRVLRLTWCQVLSRWEEVEVAVLAALRS